MLYFDHAASTPIYPEVLDFLKVSLQRDFANPSAAHILGKQLDKEINEVRQYFLKTIGADLNDHFVFTSSATESNNMIIRGLNLRASDAILFSMGDHKSVVEPVNYLKREGVILYEISHRENGQLDIEKLNFWLADNQSEKVKLLVLSLVNNQSGNIADVNLIAQKFKTVFPLAHVHIDAVQGYSKFDYKINANIDSLSIASHKMGGPKSMAGLYIRRNNKITPLLFGGGQQSGLRSSTENYPMIKAMQMASEISFSKALSSYEKIKKFESLIKVTLCENVQGIRFPFEETTPYIMTFVIPGIPSDVILRHLETKGIYLSSTSACSSRIKSLNPTLSALKIPEKWHKHVLRLSQSMDTEFADVELFLEEFLSLWNEIKYLAK